MKVWLRGKKYCQSESYSRFGHEIPCFGEPVEVDLTDEQIAHLRSDAFMEVWDKKPGKEAIVPPADGG